MVRIIMISLAMVCMFHAYGYSGEGTVLAGFYYAVNAKPVLNVRMSPGEKARLLFRILDGEIVYVDSVTNVKATVGGKDGYWANVVWNNQKGWVFTAFLADPEKMGMDGQVLNIFDEFNVKTKKGVLTLNSDRISEGCDCAEEKNVIKISFVVPVILYYNFSFTGKDIQLICPGNKNRKKVKIGFTVKDFKKETPSEMQIIYTINFQVHSVKVQ